MLTCALTGSGVLVFFLLYIFIKKHCVNGDNNSNYFTLLARNVAVTQLVDHYTKEGIIKIRAQSIEPIVPEAYCMARLNLISSI